MRERAQRFGSVAATGFAPTSGRSSRNGSPFHTSSNSTRRPKAISRSITKGDLRCEGFDRAATRDPIYFDDPASNAFVPLDGAPTRASLPIRYGLAKVSDRACAATLAAAGTPKAATVHSTTIPTIDSAIKPGGR
jgi:hypothetical protein